ncbi:soluble lytic murein transglycosylase [Steroidobacter denitrificans]|uniref:Soluble lytic murein transglycosylase n=1 Tax=Steroidobacter denitrificans TaxID=465721 RepID=A0A127F7X5_STEDE|nr:lytic transglycosylase domain-containing protein [Steroidobacter denitrificans]AMN45721.1 soluble lytic murein transglycosylase [Steroidobacter denitrificans]
MPRFLSLILSLGILPMNVVPAQGATDSLAQAREAFRQAYARVDTEREPAPDDEMLRRYPLYPYLEAARIRRALADVAAAPGKTSDETLGAADEHAASFLMHHAGEPVAAGLRGVWLASLAKRRQWTEFLQHAEAGQGAEHADSVLECHALHARVALDRTVGLVPLIAARWLTPRSIPDCQVPFDWLRDQGELTAQLIERRVKLALRENNPGFARQIMAALPEQRAAPLRQWAALLQNPRTQIDALIAAPERQIDAEGLLAGWTRLARTDRDAAIVRYEALVHARNLTPSSVSRYALALALPLSWDRRAESLTYFRRVQPADLDDTGLEWQARAALWAQDWPLVTRSIAAMTDQQRGLARWRYWAGRAAEQTGDTDLAQHLYQSILPDDNFYSMMAAAHLGQALAPHPEKLVRDDVLLRRIERQPAFVRSRELLRLNMRAQAHAEWNYGLGILPDETRPQAIHLARRWGWYDQAVATATQHRVFNAYEVLYPRPYDMEVAAAERFSGVSGELVYGVIRQESLYRSDAVSSAGARGLMQMLPETARRISRQWKRPAPQIQDLFDPRTNVLLGAAYLRELIDRFNGQTIVALAGYNAGPGASARWLPARAIAADIWIENIPYNETRNYVQRILWHQLVFSWLKTGEPQKTSAWLVNIVPQVAPQAEKQLAIQRVAPRAERSASEKQ